MVRELYNQTQTPKLKLSETLKDLVDYCNEREEMDPFLNPARADNNPFRSKSKCSLI